MPKTETLYNGTCVCIAAADAPEINLLRPEMLRSLLLERGAVLLRGFQMDVPAFERLVESLADATLVQAGARQRSSKSDVIQQVNPGSDAIAPHCENAFTPIRPDLAFFMCERPAERGGETTLTPGATVAHNLAVAAPDLGDTPVRYCAIYSREVWSRMFGTDQTALVRAMLARVQGLLDAASAVEFGFELSDEGMLSYDYVTAPFVNCRRGERVFGDSYAGFATTPPANRDARPETIWVTGRHGDPYPERFRTAIHAAIDAATYDVTLSSGDVLVLDNWSVLHGRRAFDGPRTMHAAFAYASWLRPEERGPVPFNPQSVRPS